MTRTSSASKKRPTQKAILRTDSKPETANKNSFRKSRKRTSLREFAARQQLRPEVLAGFRVWLKGEEYHFDSEWDTLYNEYMNR